MLIYPLDFQQTVKNPEFFPVLYRTHTHTILFYFILFGCARKHAKVPRPGTQTHTTAGTKAIGVAMLDP